MEAFKGTLPLRFQSTPPHGGRHPFNRFMPRHGSFNPRPRMGGDCRCLSARTPSVFQSTPPHGGRRDADETIGVINVFQSTPPHGGRRDVDHDLRLFDVSIHAPAWGATADDLQKIIDKYHVSIHAPAWGATGGRLSVFQALRFQSTPPHGGRLHLKVLRLFQLCFNPRPRIGGDSTTARTISAFLFQSTPPHRGRRTAS